MFRAPLWPSSGAQEYYTVVAACGIWFFGFQVDLRDAAKAASRIVVPETCLASNKICNKNLCCI